MSDDKEPSFTANANQLMYSIITEQINKQEDEQNKLDEMHDQLLRTMEIQIEILKMDLSSKDAEIEILVEEINRHREATKVQFEEANDLSRQFDEIIRGLHERNEELETENEQLNHSAMKHLQIIERLEMEVERLRAENSRYAQQNKEYSSGYAKVQMHSPRTDGPSNLNDSGKYRRTSVRGNAFDFLQLSTEGSFINDNLKSYDQYEELWFNQLENLKEQLENEKTKTRDLEFLVMGLKSSNQHLTLEVSKLNEEKKTLEFKYEALKNEHDKINETRLNEKLKIDSLISFCNLIENCNLPSEDLAQQLTHLPEIITNYLKGYVSTLTFRKSTDSQLNSNKVIKNSKIRQIVKRSALNPEFNIQRMHKGISEVKETMVQMLQTMKQIGGRRNKYSDSFALKNIEVLEDQFPVSKPMAQSIKTEPLKTDSFFLSRALLHPQGLLWNLQKVNQVSSIPNIPNSGDETDDESDDSDLYD